MQSLKNSSISPIKDVPGLYISDRFAARSYSLLASLDISHVLSITRIEDMPKFTESQNIVQKQIDIDDDPTEDMLCHLKDACDWIDTGLHNPCQRNTPTGVVVHCTQGISRSGSVIIAYLMRTFKLSYSEAFRIAQRCRHLIKPNPGFERQLEIWGECQYDVYNRGPAGSPTLLEKPAYRNWKLQRDYLISQRLEGMNEQSAKSTASAQPLNPVVCNV